MPTHTKENSSFTESKKVLEQKCNALSSLKAAKEVELKLLRKKLGIVVDFSERRKVAAEE